MSERQDSALETQLEQLRNVTTETAAQRVRSGVSRQLAGRRRVVLLALVATAVAALATGVFVAQRDPFGYFALTFTTVLLAWTALRFSREARELAELGSARQMLTRWRSDVSRELRQTMLAQLVAFQFSLLTAWVLWRHGLVDYRGWIYLVTALLIWVYALYQLLVVRPSLRRELELIADDQ
ncbi:MAG: hypothetical protein AAF552_17860 [Pseudomonadota bacterium]